MSTAQIIAGGQPIPNRTDPGAIGTNVGLNDGNVVQVGMPVVLNVPEDTAVYSPCKADALQRARVTALVTELIGGDAAGDHLRVQFQGIMTLTEAEWEAVTAGAGIVPGNPYYLSDSVSGGLTDTPNATSGHFVTLVGWALSATQLQVQIGTPIKNP